MGRKWKRPRYPHSSRLGQCFNGYNTPSLSSSKHNDYSPLEQFIPVVSPFSIKANHISLETRQAQEDSSTALTGLSTGIRTESSLSQAPRALRISRLLLANLKGLCRYILLSPVKLTISTLLQTHPVWFTSCIQCSVSPSRRKLNISSRNPPSHATQFERRGDSTGWVTKGITYFHAGLSRMHKAFAHIHYVKTAGLLHRTALVLLV